MQINSNTTNKTLRDLVKKDSYRVIITADINSTQDTSKENLEKVK